MSQKILEFSYDPIVKAMYITLKDTKVARTIRPDHNLSLDLDVKGDLVGIEVIKIKQAKVITKQIRTVAKQYHIPELKKVHVDKFQEVYT
jgi:uncharacterized protein YuzE